jgi:FemAB-related protein (PEP-CTERM system-associated)
MHIVEVDSSYDARWNEFVQRSPRASFYHRVEWRGINERCFGHLSTYLAAIDRDSIVGVMPVVRLKSLLFGTVACSMPFVNYGGACADSDEIEHQLVAAASDVAAAWRADYLEIRSRTHLGDRYPGSDHKVSMTIELDPEPEQLWQRFKTGHRNEVRRAQKYGFTTRFGADLLDDFYDVLSESWRDLGTPIYRRSYLKAVLAAFPDATRLCVVYAQDGMPVAGAFDGIHNGVVEGMWLGMKRSFRKQLVGYVLYWELIKHACEMRCHTYHLGRSSKDSSAEQFKKKWNAEATQLYWHYFLRTRTTVPQLNVENPRYRMAINGWRRLPIAVTQAIGPMIARSIP